MEFTEIDLPEAPALVLTLVAILTPYVVSLVNGVTHFTGLVKRFVSLGISVAVAGASLAIYYVLSGDPVPGWKTLLLLLTVASQASYALVTKNSAKALEDKVAQKALDRAARQTPSVAPAGVPTAASLAASGGWPATDEDLRDLGLQQEEDSIPDEADDYPGFEEVPALDSPDDDGLGTAEFNRLPGNHSQPRG